jgi:hypothetical protein
VWLDRGELARLMQLEKGADELLALQKRVSVGADPDELARRRMLWRNDLEARRRKTGEVNAWLDAEKARKAAEAEAAAKRRAEAEAEAKRLADAAADAAAAAARVEAVRRFEALARHTKLLGRRAEAVELRDRLQQQLDVARADVSRFETQLAEVVKQVADIEAELKLSEIETR